HHFAAQAFRQSLDRVLGGRISRRERVAVLAGHRADHHDPAFGPFSDGSEPSSGPKACVEMIGPITLTSIWRRNSSAASSSTGPATAMPALLTRPNSVSPFS